ncbi:hypothetical protein BDR05DRAFT_964300 [Suillus weaverae]|nr:hypothetical protein BDR05DRAFT_964300 [Suillus weaverae]
MILPDKYPRDRVDKLNEKRQLQLKIADRRATDVNDRMTQKKIMPILRRNTEVVIHDLDEYMSCQKARCTSKARTEWQNPGVAFLFLFLFSCLTSTTTVLQSLPISWSFPKIFRFIPINYPSTCRTWISLSTPSSEDF